MFERHFSPIAIRAVIAAACLSLLAGCAGSTATSAAEEAASSSATSSAPATAGATASSTVTPLAPTNLAATAGNAQVNLTWTASSGATSYKIKRSTTSGGPYVQIGTATSAAYTDSTVSNGAVFYYVVNAVNSQGTSVDSTQASATPNAAIATPSVPTGLIATAGNGQVSLNWSASSGATSYKVKRSTISGASYVQIGSSTSTSLTDSTSINGTTYYYVVSAVNSNGESATSAQASATPVAPSTSPPASPPPSAPPPTTFGTWINVTPLSVLLNSNLGCGNYGTETVQADPAHPAHLYAQFNCQGIWKSTDYGATWTGPINTGMNGATVSDCAGGITISPSSTASVPTIYEACIRGSGTGFWKSVDGGVNWTRYFVSPSGSGRQDYYPPVVDPYDQNHLLMAGHEMNYLVESIDGGQTWTNVSVANGMSQNGGTGAIFFINTGNASSTRGTWLWMAQQAGGGIGTWRTTNSGASWTQVDSNEHPHGSSQIYQPDNNGVVYMVGAYSALGWGVLRSSNYGQTWTHVGNNSNGAVVVGTSKNLYAMFGYPVGIGGTADPALQVAAQPGGGTWITPGTPISLAQGAAQIAVVNDGTHNILVGAMWNSGLWRYIEP